MEHCRQSRLVETVVAFALVVTATGCKRHVSNGDDTQLDAAYDPDACEGNLSCFLVDCAGKGLPPTSISGRVFAPNGTLPLYGVNVYVPITDPGPLVEGAVCDRCANGLPGGAYTQTVTDENGDFTLPNVPATTDVPVIVQVLPGVNHS